MSQGIFSGSDTPLANTHKFSTSRSLCEHMHSPLKISTEDVAEIKEHSLFVLWEAIMEIYSSSIQNRIPRMLTNGTTWRFIDVVLYWKHGFINKQLHESIRGKRR